MLIVDRIQQLIMLVLVACSGSLLGIGQQNFGLSALAVSAATLSFVLNDWLQWIRLSRWVANVVALLVTAIALRGFFHSDSPQQLVMIANLLIYLQIVLLFQYKTPRVYWQILVLSLLQIVVAAAFNIRFEGGIVFLSYLLFSAIAMVILQVHSQTHQIRTANRRTLDSMGLGEPSKPRDQVPLILVMHDQIYPNRRPLSSMIRQVFALGLVSIGFAAVTFYLIPRDEITWIGSQLTSEQLPGASRTMDLEENVQIYLSNEVVLEATFFDSNMNRRFELPAQPYLRGMPLGTLLIKNNQTRWSAPNDAAITEGRNSLPGLWTRDFIVQSIKLQPTQDPLLHTILPAMRLASTPAEIEWNVQLSLLSQMGSFPNEMGVPFQYDLAIPIGRNRQPLPAFPHGDLRISNSLRLENQPAEFSRYTYLEPSRYPGLIQLAEQEAARLSNRRDSIAVAQALTDYLLTKGGFTYTLDFSNIHWDNSLDHIEDFVVNKRRGHCEFFASALTLMLRSQKIPARVVVGFHGGDFDEETESYVVRKRNAHAWVEAYIEPEDCPQAWFRNGQASAAGAWLRLDATPVSNDVTPTTPLTAARDFWNTYVMGLNSAKQRDSAFQSFVRNPFRNIWQYFSLRYWQSQWQIFTTKGQWHKSTIFYILLLLTLISGLVAFNQWIRSRRRVRTNAQVTIQSTSFKKILGRAISLVAPRLGRWMAGDDSVAKEVAFFQRFLRILQRPGLQRFSFQTAREFGQIATQFFAQHQQAAVIGTSIESVVDKFYWVRFSQRELTSVEMQQVEASLAILEQHVTPAGLTK